jgi:hypothetical protein
MKSVQTRMVVCVTPPALNLISQDFATQVPEKHSSEDDCGWVAHSSGDK